MKKLLLLLLTLGSLSTAVIGKVYFERAGKPAINVSQPCIGILELSGSINHASSTQFKADLEKLVRNPLVQGIVLIINSGGGSPIASYEILHLLKTAQLIKPIVTYVESVCASGAYLIACCTPIIASPMATIGSIGVILEIEQEDPKTFKRDGLKGDIKKIRMKRGKFKQLGNDPLDIDSEAQLNKELDLLYEYFVNSVVEHRHLSTEEVKQTEALTYPAPEALKYKLINKIGTFSDTLSDMKLLLNTRGGSIDNTVDLSQSLIYP